MTAMRLAVPVGGLGLWFGGSPDVMKNNAVRSCANVIFWASDQIGNEGNVMDVSLGPFVAGEGVLPWMQAELGCDVRVFDLGHVNKISWNPARAVVPERYIKGSMKFQVASTHRLVPVPLPVCDYFVMISTIEILPRNVVKAVFDQALNSSKKVIVAETSFTYSPSSWFLWFETPKDRRVKVTPLKALLDCDDTVVVEKEERVGPYKCYVLSRARDL